MTSIGRSQQQAADAVDRAIDRAAGARPIPGNQVRLFFDGPATFAQMLELIETAERWVHLESYIFRSDQIGHRFADALARRAREGLPVRVMVDWFGSWETRRRFWRRMTDAGVEIRQFHRPRPGQLRTLLSRNHRKLVVADGSRAILGGLCIGDEWAGDPARGRLPWRDSSILVEGPGAAGIDQTFAETWRLTGPPLPPEHVAADVPERGNAAIRVLAGEPARERAYRVSELLLAGASERVWVTDAYLVAPRRLFRYLVDAAREGVDVRLLVPGSSDVPWVRNVTRIGYRDLLRAGVRIFEWGGSMLHAKTVVADGRWVRIGSSNLNHSSLSANFELDVLLDDPRVGHEMEIQFRRDLESASEVVTRPVRVPRISAAFPAALSISNGPDAPHRPGFRERRERSLLAVRTLAAGARLALFGPLALLLTGVGVLFFFFPRAMAVVFGVLFSLLALVIGGEALRRHHDRVPRSGR